MPSATDRRIQEVLARALKGVRLHTLAAVRAAWQALDMYYAVDTDGFAATVAPIVGGGQRATAALMETYLSAYAGQYTKTPIPVVDLNDVTGTAVRNGAQPIAVYQRAGKEVAKYLALGHPLNDAIEAGLRRALNMTATDLQLSKTHTARGMFGRMSGVVGYRRVLTGNYSCGLCVVASTQRYHRANLMPIHPGCDCMVLPIIGTHDPGQVLDEQTLAGAHDSIREQFGEIDYGGRAPDYRKVLVTHEHGEIGPVLGVRGQQFIGPGDIAA